MISLQAWLLSERVIVVLTPTQQLFGYIMARTSYFSMK
jgi:hypothetical protein